jgi:hypothetical protein
VKRAPRRSIAGWVHTGDAVALPLHTVRWHTASMSGPSPAARPSTRRRPIAGWSLLVSLLGLSLLFARWWSDRAPDAAPSDASRAQLFIAIDGLSWEAFRYAQSRGLFARFQHSSPMIAPYPSMSHPGWAEIMQLREVFGSRNNIRTVEARWFDLDAMRVADDPRQVIERQASPFNYMRAFDTYFNPLIEPFMYFPGRRVFNDEVAQTERDILDGFPVDEGNAARYNVYFSGTDATAHTHLDAMHPFLVQIDSMLTRVMTELASRGAEPEVWLVSDHGNVGAFAEGEAESYVMPVSVDAAIRRAGLVRRDTGTVIAPNEVAVVTIALASMVNMYFPDLSKRRAVATEALREPGVSLATWLEVRDDDRHIVVLGPDSTETHLRWRDSSYRFTAVRGNPLQLPDSLLRSDAWIPDSVMRRATEDGPYPDAAHRLVQSATKQVENAPDLIVNLHDGYAHDGEFGRVVRMVRTHGSLSARATLGVVASTHTPLPRTVRAGEVMAVMGTDPHRLYSFADEMHPADPLARARAQRTSGAAIATGLSDQSVDATFLRRARVIVQSMAYFPFTTIRSLLSGASGGDGRTEARVKETRALLENVDVLAGLTYGVDTLISLADSLDGILEGDALERRLTEAERRLRENPELAPFASVRDIWTDDAPKDTTPGGGALLRQATMAAWTIPYFLDVALDGPEMDSVPDPRDASFAVRWFAKERSRVREEPLRVLEQPVLAATLFREVFAERELWQRIEPAVPPLYFAPDLSDITVVLVPGIYGELFDGELWQRGLKAVRDRLGVRTFTAPVDGRCSAEYNAPVLRAALRDDIARRRARGYEAPRYLLIGYSKGGIDATHMLLADSALAHEHVAALVTVATPHLGSPVAERSPLPAPVLRWGVRTPLPAPCDSASAAASLWPGTRAAFWADHEQQVATRANYFSLSFTSDMQHAHPFMKITKRVGQFTEPNDGVVALRASQFPSSVPAVHLGTIDADHIAGITASSFPQEAFMEAIVLTLGELGVLDPAQRDAWRDARTTWRADRASRRGASTRVPSFASALRDPDPLPGGSTGWTPSATFRMGAASSFGNVDVAPMRPSKHPEGIRFRCDQADMLGFRREYEFLYDAGNGGRESDARDGFSVLANNGSESGRVCQLATTGSAIKMTTVAHRFSLAEFPALDMRLQVLQNVRAVDPSRRRRGANDAAFKLWFVLRDMRDTAADNTRLFGYTWSAPDRDGVEPPDGALIEAVSSKRNLVVTTLPEAWLVNIGGTRADGAWQRITRDLAADVKRAFPDVPVSAHQVVGITVQSDSDESRGTSRVLLDYIGIGRR